MLDVLYKKANGYVIEETTEEYGIDENNQPKLIKKKVHNKYIPPDMTAIKAYMKYLDNTLKQMSEEELQREKERLLKQLKNIQSGEQNEKKR